MPDPPCSSALETFVLLANCAKGAAAAILVKQVLEAPGVYVFGELLDHPNISDLEQSHIDGPSLLKLLRIFAYGTYEEYLQTQSVPPVLPELSPPMLKKLRLLTIATLATKNKIIDYAELKKELRVDGVRELEDLIIEGANNTVLRGKLDQKSSCFEVDYAMGRDIKKSDIADIEKTLKHWCESCSGMLVSLEQQVMRANEMKQTQLNHQKQVELKVTEIRNQLKAQQQLSEGPDDPDSRMETSRDRREKIGKAKGQRGAGTKSGFWQKPM